MVEKISGVSWRRCRTKKSESLVWHSSRIPTRWRDRRRFVWRRAWSPRRASVRAYDPVAHAGCPLELNGSVRYCETAYAVAEGAEALVVGTGWPEFRALDFGQDQSICSSGPLIVDTKNLLDSVQLRAMGFHYVGVGRV